MANTCYNWIEVYGDEASISKLKERLIAENEVNILDIADEPNELTFFMESRWVAPLDWLEEISLEYKVLVECESEESGCDYWCKVAYKDGENVFGVQLNYLEGKYRSLDWNEFIECEVMWRLEDSDPFDEFIKQFDFCNEEEIAELEELFFEHSNED